LNKNICHETDDIAIINISTFNNITDKPLQL
jgi:hypothetical protein